MQELQNLLDGLYVDTDEVLSVNNIVKFHVTDYVGDMKNPKNEDLLDWEQAIIFFNDGTAKIVSVDQAENYAEVLSSHGVSVDIEEQTADFITKNYKKYQDGQMINTDNNLLKKENIDNNDDIGRKKKENIDNNDDIDKKKMSLRDRMKKKFNRKKRKRNKENEDEYQDGKIKTFLKGLSMVVVFPTAFVYKRIDNLCNKLNKKFHPKVDVEDAKTKKIAKRNQAKGFKRIFKFVSNTFDKFTSYCVDRVYGEKEEEVEEVREVVDDKEKKNVDVEDISDEQLLSEDSNKQEQSIDLDSTEIYENSDNNQDLEEFIKDHFENSNNQTSDDWFDSYFNNPDSYFETTVEPKLYMKK